MEYYNSQCLLYNLVRENNLLKSQIDKLNNIIANNKSSTSENTTNGNKTSGLSKDEVTQLIQNNNPKEHEHTSSDINDRINEYLSKPIEATCTFTKSSSSIFLESFNYISLYIPDFINTWSITIEYNFEEKQLLMKMVKTKALC